MKLTILGMNGPFPAPGGATSGYLLESDNGETKLLIECGSGVLARATRYVKIEELSAIVLSHLHFDHMSDMGVLQYLLQFTPMRRNLPVIAPREPETVRRLIECDRLDFIEPQDRTIGEMRLSFLPAVHPVPGVCLRVECDGRSFFYTGDTNQAPGLELMANGANLILADAGLNNAQWNPAAPHLSAGLCGELARDAGAEALILTHLRPGNDPETLLSQAQAAFPGAQLAKAGSRYVI